MIRPGLDSDINSTLFTTGHRLVTWRGFIKVLRKGVERNLWPTVNKKTTVITVKGRGSLLLCSRRGGHHSCFCDLKNE